MEIEQSLENAKVPIVIEELKRRKNEVQAKLNKNFAALKFNRTENALTAVLSVGILLVVVLVGLGLGVW